MSPYEELVERLSARAYEAIGDAIGQPEPWAKASKPEQNEVCNLTRTLLSEIAAAGLAVVPVKMDKAMAEAAERVVDETDDPYDRFKFWALDQLWFGTLAAAPDYTGTRKDGK